MFRRRSRIGFFCENRNLTVFRKNEAKKIEPRRRSRIGFFCDFFNHGATDRRSRIGFFCGPCKNRVNRHMALPMGRFLLPLFHSAASIKTVRDVKMIDHFIPLPVELFPRKANRNAATQTQVGAYRKESHLYHASPLK